jgi:hypothetical protein
MIRSSYFVRLIDPSIGVGHLADRRLNTARIGTRIRTQIRTRIGTRIGTRWHRPHDTSSRKSTGNLPVSTHRRCGPSSTEPFENLVG